MITPHATAKSRPALGGECCWRLSADGGGERDRETLGQQRRHGVADLNLRGAACAGDLVVVRESLQALDLGETEPPALPMERPYPRARLRLDRWRRLIRVELEQEIPVARTPLKQRLRVSALRGEVEVVLARRHLREEM